MTIRAILFDFDGTLVDSEPLHCQLWQRLLRQYSITLSERDYQCLLLGNPSAKSAELLVEQFTLPISAQTLIEQPGAARTPRLLEAPPPLMPDDRQTLTLLKYQG